MIDPAILDAMVAAGASVDVIVAAVKADQAKDEARRESKRANNAERQQRYRDARNANNALLDVTDVIPPTLDKSPHTPKINPTPGVHTHEAPARRATTIWPCPEGVNPTHWRDFLTNRRAKKLGTTETAHAGQLKALATLSDDEWPPGRLVEFAAAKGWGSINDPRDDVGPKYARRSAPHRMAGNDGSGIGPTERAALRALGR